MKGSLREHVINSAVGSAVPAFLALVTSPILAQTLGVEDRGRLASGQAYVLLLTAVTSLGLPETLTFFGRKQIDQHRRAQLLAWTSIVLVGSLCTAWLLFEFSGPLSRSDKELASALRLAAWALPPSVALGALRGQAAAREQWSIIAIERITGSLFRLAAIVLLAAADTLTLQTAVLAALYVPLTSAISYCALLGKSHGRLSRRPAERVSPYGFGLKVWVGALAGLVIMRADQVLLGPLAGPEQLGLYVVAVTVGEVPLLLTASFRDVLFARAAGDFDSRVIERAARLAFVTTTTVCVSIAIFAPVAVPLLFGNEFSEAVEIIFVLLVSVAFGAPGSVAGAALFAIGRPDLRAASLCCAAIVNLGLVASFAPSLGAMGAAVSMLGTNVISNGINLGFSRRFAGVRPASCWILQRNDLRFIQLSLRKSATS